MEPVSIRAKNPGAMWPGPVATKFGSTEWWPCGGNNRIAVFPTYEQGGAAEFYLWATKYNLPLKDAIYKWSGHNSSPEYASFLIKHVPGLTMDTVISENFLGSPMGLQFMKVQSQWEAGKPYPMTDEQWRAAQAICFGRAVSPIPPPPDIPTLEPGSPQNPLVVLINFIISLFRRK